MRLSILKLIAYALGSVVMYWGFLLCLAAPLLLGAILVALADSLWQRVTGRSEASLWLEQISTVAERLSLRRLAWLGWLPAMVIQLWYAGYAAHWATTSTQAGPTAIAAGFGLVAIALAAAVFYGLYAYVLELNAPDWAYGLVGGSMLLAYAGLLQRSQTAAALSRSWERVFSAVLAAWLASSS